MNDNAEIWVIIFGMALVTFVPRVLPLVSIDENNMPNWVRRGLRYVPIAVLTAIVSSAYVPSETWLHFTLDERLIAGSVAIMVAYFSQNTLATILSGLVVLIVLSG